MTRLPGWIVLDVQQGHVRDGQLVCTLRIRRWHPSYWPVAVRRWLRRR